MSAPPRNRAVLALLLVLVLGLAVRGWGIALPGLSSDEAFSWRIVQYPTAEMVQRLATDVHPPLYFLLLQAWVGLCGESLLMMRGLSAGLGLLAVLVAFAVGREAALWSTTQESKPIPAGLLAASLVAIHAGQVAAGRNVRMYTLGVLLAGLTALFLLRALRCPERSRMWFLAYGLAAAAFAFTHYYAFFTIVGQLGLGAMWAAWRWRTGQQGEALHLFRGLGLGALTAVLVFAPWLPAFLRQSRGVRESYWISPVSLAALDKALVLWATGLEPQGSLARIALLAVLGVAAWSVWRSGRAGIFLVTQALAPWLLAVGLSLVSGRPIFLERYLVFAQLPLLLLLALGGSQALSRKTRFLALLPILILAAGLGQSITRYPTTASAAAQAGQALMEKRQFEDLVLVESPRALNRMLYWLTRSAAGSEIPTVRCVLPRVPTQGDRFSHLASLKAEDILWEDQLAAVTARRLWQARDSRYPPEPIPGWSRTALRIFEGGDGSWYTLTRWVRQGQAAAADPSASEGR